METFWQKTNPDSCHPRVVLPEPQNGMPVVPQAFSDGGPGVAKSAIAGRVSIWRSNSEKRGWIMEREFRLDEFDLESYARDRGCLKLHERLKPFRVGRRRDDFPR
jgi:hypothetical protein